MEKALPKDINWAVQQLEFQAYDRVSQGGILLEETLPHEILTAFHDHCRTLANALAVMTERALKAEAALGSPQQAQELS